ncbi:Tfx family DNA-binding protein [Halovivax gelatinilyticus]|uniref:Tfx family DNA-binding protein n=1 Tax=Halovivax gelatinilyticus TaxID=2961597 RepID=UPI00211549A4|nr:Tfx family DNA-binding protein [Halovivax gelatinilyticus]
MSLRVGGRSDRHGPATASTEAVVIEEIDAFLDEVGFDPDASVLTRRQAQVLALRERGESQATIAEAIGSSRANVSSIEASGRENVERARETVAFAEALHAPVRVQIPAGTDLYDVPQKVFEACDEEGVKVSHTAPDLMKVVSDAAGPAVSGRQVGSDLVVGVTATGSVRVRTSERTDE